jgi:thiamine biosynthesis lipoprotein
MGTVVSFDVRRGTAREEQVFLALAEARRRLHHADAVFSTWKPHSPMSLIRRGELTVDEAPPDVRVVLERCELARRVSGGWFDPWAMPGGLDPTGLVKGWAAERALEPLVDAAVTAAMVSAAGDIAVWGRPESGRPWRIGIQDPWNRLGVIGVVEVQDAVATSGVYERGMHVLDPTTGAAATAAVSATVIGPQLDLADALATGLLAGADAALEHIAFLDGYEALLIHPDRSCLATPGFTLLS